MSDLAADVRKIAKDGSYHLHVDDYGGLDVPQITFNGTLAEFLGVARRLLSRERLSEEEIKEKYRYNTIDEFFDQYPVTEWTRAKHKARVQGKIDGYLEAQAAILGPVEECGPAEDEEEA